MRQNQPSPIGVAVDQAGIFDDRLVDFGNLAGHRGVDVARRLGAFDRGAGFAFGDLAGRLGQLDEDDVAERLLRVVGDADRECAVIFQADPFMVAGVTGFSHGNL